MPDTTRTIWPIETIIDMSVSMMVAQTDIQHAGTAATRSGAEEGEREGTRCEAGSIGLEQ